jgi:hypothetical protein
VGVETTVHALSSQLASLSTSGSGLVPLHILMQVSHCASKRMTVTETGEPTAIGVPEPDSPATSNRRLFESPFACTPTRDGQPAQSRKTGPTSRPRRSCIGRAASQDPYHRVRRGSPRHLRQA